MRAALSAGFALLHLASISAELLAPGFDNPYYQVHGYRGSRVLEHNETDRFAIYIEAVWTQHATVDKAGRTWLVDKNQHQVVLMESSTRYVAWPAFYKEYAGTRGLPGYFDGSRLQARFNSPQGIAVHDQEGQSLVLFVADTNNHVIRRIEFATGRVSTIAGLPGHPGLRDGNADRARLSSPMSLAVDAEGSNLFILDNGHRIRHLDLVNSFMMTLADGACRAVKRWTAPGAIMLRTVGCHTDWSAKDAGDGAIDEFVFESICVGHQATCGPRNHPALNDTMSPFLHLDESKEESEDL